MGFPDDEFVGVNRPLAMLFFFFLKISVSNAGEQAVASDFVLILIVRRALRLINSTGETQPTIQEMSV